MPCSEPIFKTLEDLSDHRSVRIVKSNLTVCGCLSAWEQFIHLSNKGKNLELDIIRLRYCIGEQCWDNRDIDFQLSESDKSVPFPKPVLRCLTNKLKNARNLRRDAFASVSEQRRALDEGHRQCHPQANRDLNTVFRATKALMGEIEALGKTNIRTEINDLIKNSRWQALVDPAKVCNLTTNEVSSEALEFLSLGADFKLKIERDLLLILLPASSDLMPDIQIIVGNLISIVSKLN